MLGSYSSQTTYYFDQNGFKTKSVAVSSFDTTNIQIGTCHYDDKGYLTKTENTRQNGETMSRQDYTYNDHGLLEKGVLQSFLSDSTSMVYTNVYQYDDK